MNQILFIPGLGDRADYIGDITKHWPKRFGLEVSTYQFNWGEPVDTYEPKKQNLFDKLETLSEVGKVAVAGISAGANVAMMSLVERPDLVACAINICGLVRLRPQDMNDRRIIENPLLEYSIAQLDDSKIKGEKVITMRSVFETVVNKHNVPVKGARNIVLPIPGHSTGIVYALLTKGKMISTFINQQAERVK